MFSALLNSVADDHWVRSFSPGVALTVTPPAPAIVTCPAPVCRMSIEVPTGYATDEFVGIVTVTPVAEETSTSLSRSARTVV